MIFIKYKQFSGKFLLSIFFFSFSMYSSSCDLTEGQNSNTFESFGKFRILPILLYSVFQDLLIDHI